ncbi:formate dehydrogenase accessory sulfurtransferase FdhD [Pedobacter sp. GSP4]|uniref:formate dehydrogenase accessory sulfurtransferase FdhD n=1 Tax=Pedobacter sp. GSP4 TaxID=3453716 RepID=UPI003EED1F09
MKNPFEVSFFGEPVPPTYTSAVQVRKISDELEADFEDTLAVEEPLEIRLAFAAGTEQVVKSISVTMRTPGNDEELAKGFLFTEGIIDSNANLKKSDVFICGEGRENTITLLIEGGSVPDLSNSERNFYSTSSCGVCGKSSIASIRTLGQFKPIEPRRAYIDSNVLLTLPDALRKAQRLFSVTGGLHACGIFTPDGELIGLREDVGRHNALDKLIGKAFSDGILPLSEHILLLSGRASFELVQKAAMAGITVIAAIGAPSSLAVELAAEFNITLIGFLRGRSFNIYTGAERIK